MTLAFINLLLGLLVLYLGAETLVRGSTNLALAIGIRPLVVGMTIVAFATSMPEMMVSLSAAFKGSNDIAAGNIIGSNVANVGLILGFSALLSSLKVHRDLLKRELPFMILISVVLCFFVNDGLLSFVNGLVLFGFLLFFIGYCLCTSRDEESSPVVAKTRRGHWLRNCFFVVIGIVGLAGGAELMVRSAVVIARGFGVSELVIGITIVAIGTSLPELAASLVSALKGEMEISVGNVIGSNIFNLGFVLGVCPMIRPLPVDRSLLYLELPVMLLFSLALFPVVFRSGRLGRKQGGLFLLAYFLFIGVMAMR